MKMFWNLFFLSFIATSPVLTSVVTERENNCGTGKSCKCILPPYPNHGNYAVRGVLDASPGQKFNTALVNFTCDPGYGIIGESVAYCLEGTWSLNSFPQCVRFCKLNKHPSVEYRCIEDSTEGTRPCNNQEPTGTIVRPVCNAPNYYYSGKLSNMRCIDGIWDYVAICSPECGRKTPEGQSLIHDGWAVMRGELPWHASVYTKTTKPYRSICGGTLVSTKVVISAAHCFWNNQEEKPQPASMFAIAVGKLYRPWDDARDVDAQKSDVSDIKIPSRFRGAVTDYQDDIAVILLTTSFELKPYIRPVCIDFDINFDRIQLQDGKLGQVASWDLSAEKPSQVIKAVDLPFMELQECLVSSPSDFTRFITSDKFCAGYRNGSNLCKGDSGGGYVFPEYEKGIERYYLRGVMSTAPRNEKLCSAFTPITFSQITKHEQFIAEFL